MCAVCVFECECEYCVSVMSVTNEHTSGENVAQNSTLTSDTDLALHMAAMGNMAQVAT